MASIYPRPDSAELWIACYPKPGGQLVRCSTGTTDPLVAGKIRRKTELLGELRRMNDIRLPGKLEEAFSGMAAPARAMVQAAVLPAPAPAMEQPPPKGSAHPASQQVRNALRSLFVRSATSNVRHSLYFAESYLRIIIGARRWYV